MVKKASTARLKDRALTRHSAGMLRRSKIFGRNPSHTRNGRSEDILSVGFCRKNRLFWEKSRQGPGAWACRRPIKTGCRSSEPEQNFACARSFRHLLLSGANLDIKRKFGSCIHSGSQSTSTGGVFEGGIHVQILISDALLYHLAGPPDEDGGYVKKRG